MERHLITELILNILHQLYNPNNWNPRVIQGREKGERRIKKDKSKLGGDHEWGEGICVEADEG